LGSTKIKPVTSSPIYNTSLVEPFHKQSHQAIAKMANTYLILSAVIAFLAVALGVAYQNGALDPIIEKIGVLFFKAEAKAEEKKLETQGLKEGQDFLAGKQSHTIFSGLKLVWILMMK
jgi:hypothetical protein